MAGFQKSAVWPRLRWRGGEAYSAIRQSPFQDSRDAGQIRKVESVKRKRFPLVDKKIQRLTDNGCEHRQTYKIGWRDVEPSGCYLPGSHV